MKKRKKLWFPTLNSIPKKLNSHSWYDMSVYYNKNRVSKNESCINNSFLSTFKYKLYPTKEQENILQLWFNDSITLYNYTNNYIKNNILPTKDYKSINFINLRNKFKDYIKSLNINNCYKHTLDYAIKLNVEMYKSALSNLRNKHIKHFNIRDLDYNRRKKNLVFEPVNFNSYGIKKLGKLKASINFNNLNINKNTILQYDNIKKEYYILVPTTCVISGKIKREEKVGIDIGVRTFLTTYSNNKSIEIGTNTDIKIRKYQNKLDKLRKDRADFKLSKNKFNFLIAKNYEKVNNAIKDLHFKTALFLVKKYDSINIGKVSTNMVSRRGNLVKKAKRKLLSLKHYEFNKILKYKGAIYNCKINEIDEYMTSKTCHNCLNINRKLGASKIYNCKKCKIEVDRDINASINILNL